MASNFRLVERRAAQEYEVNGTLPGPAREASPAHSSAKTLSHTSGCLCPYYFVVCPSVTLLPFVRYILAQSVIAYQEPFDHRDHV